MHIRNAMALKASFQKRTFHFDFAARTSRGSMREKHSWFVKIWDEPAPEIFGTGECGPLPGLSMEDISMMETVLSQTMEKINSGKFETPPPFAGKLLPLNQWLTAHLGNNFIRNNPSLTFAMESAILDLEHKGTHVMFDNSFMKGVPIPINGLVWMGGLDFMLQQVEIKIRDGFKCIKVKVGGLDFEKECDILQYIRRKYFRENIEVRLDANGAFKPDEVMYKLKAFSRFDIHSIEQPVRPGWQGLPQLCTDSPIPIALDEELIGVVEPKAKEELLDRIKPAYIILKPTIHGGFFSCDEWITLAEHRKIGWWITSALESSIGLNAVSQFAAQYPVSLAQGLGTGAIYKDNIASPLEVKKGQLTYNSAHSWDSGL
jgi:o-succinylbenzoate synthase